MEKLLKQCQQWHEEDQYELIVNAIEEIPESMRTPELSSELARAYNNVGNINDDPSYFLKAIQLLIPLQDYFTDNFKYYYRLGYSFFYTDLFPLAYDCFVRANEIQQDDDVDYFMSYIDNYLSRGAVHSREDYDIFRKYINDNFGEMDYIMTYDDDDGYAKFMVSVIKPSLGRDYFTFITMGLGSMPMLNFDNYQLERRELVMMVPANFFQSEHYDPKNEDEKWPIILLKTIGEHMFYNSRWFGVGSHFYYEERDYNPEDGSLFIVAPPPSSYKLENDLILSEGGKVDFGFLVPVYIDIDDITPTEFLQNLSEKDYLFKILPKCFRDEEKTVIN